MWNKNERNGGAAEVKGKAKQAVGRVLGNTALTSEGEADEVAGKKQAAVGKAERKVGKAIEELGKSIKR